MYAHTDTHVFCIITQLYQDTDFSEFMSAPRFQRHQSVDKTPHSQIPLGPLSVARLLLLPFLLLRRRRLLLLCLLLLTTAALASSA